MANPTADRHQPSHGYGGTSQQTSSQQPDEPIMAPTTLEKFRNYAKNNYGILILVLAQIFNSLMVLIARYLSISMPPGENFNSLHICFVRMSITAVLCYIWMWRAKVEHAPFGEKSVRGLLCLRAMAGFIGLISLYYSVKYLPLPDSTVIVFLTPTAVSFGCSIIPSIREPFTLSEKLGGLVSMVGVILIARPSFLFGPPEHSEPGNVTPEQRIVAVIVSMIGVVGAATAYTTIRWIGKRAHPLISVTYFSSATAIFSYLGLLLIPAAGGFRLPHGRLQWSLMTGIGICGFLFQYLLTKGLQVTKGGRAAGIIYTQMVFALLFEWLVWGNLPTIASTVGGVLILTGVISAEIYKSSGGGDGEGKKDDGVQSILVEEGAEAGGEEVESREPLLPTTRQ